MEGRWRSGEVVVGGDARQRFHDARGYGAPRSGNEVALAPVEAAHLLFRGDLESVDGEGFADVVADQGPAFGARFLVYADLRSRGFYLAPAREERVAEPAEDVDFLVFERGEAPPDGTVAHRVRAVGERADVPAADLGESVLAVADEEGEVTYLQTDRWAPTGIATADPPETAGRLLADRVLVPDPPRELYRRLFYGQPLGDGGEDPAAGPLQLSLVEAAYLARRSSLTVPAGESAVLDRGRSVEGERFDRRLAVYAELRERGVVPKTGFKFGADFRTYADVETVEDLGHSEALVRVLPREYVFAPRELALDVRLSHGVRKTMAFALVDDGGVTWVSAERLTP